jgi:hypothetical protein
MIVSGLVSAAVMWPVNSLFPKLFEYANTFVSATALRRTKKRQGTRSAVERATAKVADTCGGDIPTGAVGSALVLSSLSAASPVVASTRSPVSVSRRLARSPRVLPYEAELVVEDISDDDSDSIINPDGLYLPSSPFAPCSTVKLRRLGFETEEVSCVHHDLASSEVEASPQVHGAHTVDALGGTSGTGLDSAAARKQARLAALRDADYVPTDSLMIPGPTVGTIALLHGPLSTPQPSAAGLSSAGPGSAVVESTIIVSPARPETAGSVFANVVTKALDRSMAQKMLAKEAVSINRWSFATLMAVVQSFLGLFMVLIALFYLITAQDRTWRMAVCVGGGLGELAVGVTALLLLRQDRRMLGLLVVIFW